MPMRVLIRHTLLAQLRSVVVWGLSLGLFALLIIAIYAGIKDKSGLNQIVDNYPKELLELFGKGNGADLSSVEGFLSMEIFSFMAPLALVFFPIGAAANTVAGAEEHGRLELLLANPIPRWQVVVGSFIATAISLVGVLTIFGLSMWMSAVALDVDLSLATTAQAVFSLWPLCIFFGAVAMLLSSSLKTRSMTLGLAAGLAVVMYFVNGLASFSSLVEKIRPLSAFYYYGSAVETGIRWGHFFGVTIAALTVICLASAAFNRREINA